MIFLKIPTNTEPGVPETRDPCLLVPSLRAALAALLQVPNQSQRFKLTELGIPDDCLHDQRHSWKSNQSSQLHFLWKYESTFTLIRVHFVDETCYCSILAKFSKDNYSSELFMACSNVCVTSFLKFISKWIDHLLVYWTLEMFAENNYGLL